ncbi:sugar phosphate nucleotidyltransferase [Bergeyella porcorum]|uniref:sugar phosphate nucleotidyltransferase n=1 Tax=Bergeyella porcorum TaxID=1735111 RepID=UPI0035E739EB
MSSKKTLVVLAGGLGSRYNGLKQIDGIYNGYTILEYSLYDALQAGFTHFVLIINDKITDAFQHDLKQKVESKGGEVQFVVQHRESFLPKGYDATSRAKPWGTAHALLCASELVSNPFFVINADDYYGKEIYQLASQYLDNELKQNNIAVQIAFPLGKTLSESGSVSRGICKLNEQNELISVTEQTAISKEGTDIVAWENDQKTILNELQLVSMNFWGFSADIFSYFETEFQEFIAGNPSSKAEYMLPVVVQTLMDRGVLKVLVNESPSQWMGVTYATDRELMYQFLSEQTQQGNYPESLWT